MARKCHAAQLNASAKLVDKFSCVPTLFTALVICAVFFFLAPLPAAANPPVFTIVYPTGVFPDDVQNVQAALDKGGTVFLRAVNKSGVATAFNFGSAEALPGRWVNLHNDVNLIGESFGPRRATINGGYGPIFGVVPVKSRIIGIDFEGPLDDAIDLVATSGAEIAGNRINAVVPMQVQVASGRIITFADGIDLGSFGSPQNSAGRIAIAGNDIENLLSDFSNGIQIDSSNADISILGNSIKNVSSNGIAVIRAHNSVLIAGNRVVTQSPDASTGIFINGDRDASYKLVGNSVVCDAAFADGIAVISTTFVGTDGTVNALIRANHVTMHNSIYGGISLYDLATDSLVRDNEINGDGAYALQVSTFGYPVIDTASLNRFIDNDISGFTSSVADVFLDANSQNNTVIGECRTVIDLGVGNTVTCGRSISAHSATLPSTATNSLLSSTPSPGAATAALTPPDRRRQTMELLKSGARASNAPSRIP